MLTFKKIWDQMRVSNFNSLRFTLNFWNNNKVFIFRCTKAESFTFIMVRECFVPVSVCVCVSRLCRQRFRIWRTRFRRCTETWPSTIPSSTQIKWERSWTDPWILTIRLLLSTPLWKPWELCLKRWVQKDQRFNGVWTLCLWHWHFKNVKCTHFAEFLLLSLK